MNEIQTNKQTIEKKIPDKMKKTRIIMMIWSYFVND